jgi:hypothetical protein
MLLDIGIQWGDRDRFFGFLRRDPVSRDVLAVAIGQSNSTIDIVNTK